MRVRVKKSYATKDKYGGKTVDFSGLTGELSQDRVVHFDDESKKKLPKGWIKQAENADYPYDPYSYVFDEEDLEVVKYPQV